MKQYTFCVYDIGPSMVNIYAVSLAELAEKLKENYPDEYKNAWIECKELNFKGGYNTLGSPF